MEHESERQVPDRDLLTRGRNRPAVGKKVAGARGGSRRAVPRRLLLECQGNERKRARKPFHAVLPGDARSYEERDGCAITLADPSGTPWAGTRASRGASA